MTIKRGRFYKFKNQEEAREFLMQVYRQFNITCSDDSFEFYLTCPALAVSNVQDTILYKTSINEVYQHYTPWNEDSIFICGARAVGKTNKFSEDNRNMHALIKKYTDEDVSKLIDKREKAIDELYEKSELVKNIKKVNETLTKYGIANVSVKQVAITDDMKKELDVIENEFETRKKELLDKAFECQALIDASIDDMYIEATLEDYGFIRKVNQIKDDNNDN